jgi:hypothetical protein
MIRHLRIELEMGFSLFWLQQQFHWGSVLFSKYEGNAVFITFITLLEEHYIL